MVSSGLLCSAFVLLAAVQTTLSASTTRYVTTTNSDGETVYLADDRQPALYTGNFGDCLGSSAVNVTRFDAAYYKDNMTILFHLTGNTAIANESLMMYIGVYAYGEARFDLTFNPCNANIDSLCPLNASIPIEANGIIPISASDVASITPLALSIPDFEGEAILRIFANSTQSEIGCYSAVVTNGATFSQPQSVGTVLGIFALISLLASFATAIYGDSVPVMRKHYAHSLSVLVVFAVFQHVFYAGALSVNWPSVLVAWWSNFAWAGGMIYSGSMQTSIDHLIGNNIGNTSQVGAAGSASPQDGVGGGYDISQIYRRHLGLNLKRGLAYDVYQRDHSVELKRDLFSSTVEHHLQKRALANSSTGYSWYGKPVGSGLPLPGNYSGFAGTLAAEDIRVSNAFMTGFLWFLILLVLVVAAVVAFKFFLEGLVVVRLMKKNRLGFFRKHWMGYTALAALRTCFIGFFMIMFLTIFQFSYDSSGGVKAIAAIVFLIFLVGIPGCVLYACYYRLASQGAFSKPESANPDENKTPKLLAKLDLKQTVNIKDIFVRRKSSYGDDNDNSPSIHDDEDYVKKFGWLSARFRRTKWWFFSAWVLYEFIRACFYAGASGQPKTQVFGLLVVEVLAFVGIVWARPFEGRRLNFLVVYLLGFSKVATVALSAAFIVDFNLQRITTTVLGIVIIVVQGVLVVVTMIAILLGAFSSYMSLTRNREEFRPRTWAPLREKYFNHLDRTAADRPRPPPPVIVPEEPKDPYFSVASVRRVAKIEDEDPDFVAEMTMQDQGPDVSYAALSQISHTPGRDSVETPNGYTPLRRARAASRTSVASYSSLPYGARLHRPSWTSRDFNQWTEERTPVHNSRHEPGDGAAALPPTLLGARTPTRSATMPASMPKAMSSTDSLRVGGPSSSKEVIGDVPTPRVRPRSGTFSGSRSNTPTPGSSKTTNNTTATFELPPRDRRQPLTPAVEYDEELYH